MEEFKNLSIDGQVQFFNDELKKDPKISVTKLCKKYGLLKNTIISRFTKNNYHYTDRKYVNTQNDIKEVIPPYKERIIEVAVTNESPLDIKGITELLEMKEQIKEVIQSYKASKNAIDVPELKLDKSKVNGEQKCRMIKIYDSVNNDWIKFCATNDEFKMQDLYSIALSECIEKYSK